MSLSRGLTCSSLTWEEPWLDKGQQRAEWASSQPGVAHRRRQDHGFKAPPSPQPGRPFLA